MRIGVKPLASDRYNSNDPDILVREDAADEIYGKLLTIPSQIDNEEVA